MPVAAARPTLSDEFEGLLDGLLGRVVRDLEPLYQRVYEEPEPIEPIVDAQRAGFGPSDARSQSACERVYCFRVACLERGGFDEIEVGEDQNFTSTSRPKASTPSLQR